MVRKMNELQELIENIIGKYAGSIEKCDSPQQLLGCFQEDLERIKKKNEELVIKYKFGEKENDVRKTS